MKVMQISFNAYLRDLKGCRNSAETVKPLGLSEEGSPITSSLTPDFGCST